ARSLCLSILFSCITRPPPTSSLFPYTTLSDLLELSLDSQSGAARLVDQRGHIVHRRQRRSRLTIVASDRGNDAVELAHGGPAARSEEHTSELQSRENLVCRLLLEKKKKKKLAH